MDALKELHTLHNDMRATRVRDGIKGNLYRDFCDRLERAILALEAEEVHEYALSGEEPPPPPK